MKYLFDISADNAEFIASAPDDIAYLLEKVGGGPMSEVMDRDRYEVLVRSTVGVASNHGVIHRDRSDEYEALLDHDAAMRRLLSECRDVLKGTANSSEKLAEFVNRLEAIDAPS